MMLVHPLSQFIREPSLLIPGSKPVGAVKPRPMRGHWWLFNQQGPWKDVLGRKDCTTPPDHSSYAFRNNAFEITSDCLLDIGPVYDVGSGYLLFVDASLTADGRILFGGPFGHYGFFYSGGTLYTATNAVTASINHQIYNQGRIRFAMLRESILTPPILFQDGEKIGTYSTNSIHSFKLKRLSGYDDDTYRADAKIWSMALFHGGNHSDEFIKRLTADPYQFLLPA